jgi:phospholipid/cholesterol/gamma-HCH transport system substrate-binding protein
VETLTELNRTLASVRKFFEDDTLRNRLDSLLASVQKSVTRAESLLLTAQRTVQENRPALKDAIARASEAMAQLKEGVSALRALAEDPLLAEDVRTAVRGIRDATTKANELLTDLDALINDPQLRASIETTLLNVEQISRTGTEIAENTRQITSDGKIVSAKAIELADRANELAEEAKRVLEKLREFAEQLPREFRVARPSFRLESARNTERGAFQTDVIVEYPLTQKASLFAGVFDATEGNLLNLQYGLQRGSSTLRYGIYASKPGLGVDWQVVPGVLLSADLFDPNDPRLDARARFSFGKDWYLYMGANRIGDRNEPLIGLGVKR